MYFLDKKYGFYRANHGQTFLETSSKVEALELSQRNNGWVSYHFHDEIFSQYIWQEEIKTDIIDLYKQRA